MALAGGAPAGLPGLQGSRFAALLRLGLGCAWIAFQIGILFYPQAPLLERPLHLALAATVLFLWVPGGAGRRLSPWIDGLLVAATVGTGIHYLLSASRLSARMEGVDPVLPEDLLFGVLLLALLLEGVRRAVGWSLLSVLLAFLAYALAGPWIPGWLRFSGFGLEEAVEILTMSLNGVLGVTTDTSVQFVFYFILFGAVYAAVGGASCSSTSVSGSPAPARGLRPRPPWCRVA